MPQEPATSPNPEDRFLVFVSYSCNDKGHPFLGKLEEFFARPEIAETTTFYMAEDRPEFGADLVEKVLRALQRADAVLPFLSRASEGSPWVNQEIGFARARGLPILPTFDTSEVNGLRGMIQTMEACPVDDDSKLQALFDHVSVLAKSPRVPRRRELSLEFKGVWWSWYKGAFPMYVRLGITHDSNAPDSVKSVFLESAGQVFNAEDPGKLRRLDEADYQEATLKFYPISSGGSQAVKLVVHTVRNKKAEVSFEASTSGWRPPEMWNGFTPY